MKKIVLLMLISSLGLLACKTKQKNTIRLAIDPELEVDSIVVIHKASREVLKATENGNYIYHPVMEDGSYISIEYDWGPIEAKQIYLFYEKGDDLDIRIGPSLDDIQYSGKAAVKATLLSKVERLKKRVYDKLITTPQEDFDYTKAIRRDIQTELEAVRDEISTKAYNRFSIDSKYDMLYQQIESPYSIASEQGGNVRDYLPQGYFNLLEEIEHTNGRYERHTPYGLVLDQLPRLLELKYRMERDSLKVDLSQKEQFELQYKLAENYLSGDIRSGVLSSMLLSVIQDDPKESKPYVDRFVGTYANQQHSKELLDELEKSRSRTTGELVPDFTLQDLNGTDVAFSSFKGKVVYMDIWGSWCVPCREEMQHAPKLHAQFKDNKDVIFLYVSIDNNEDDWKKAIKDDRIEGVHLLSKSGLDSKIAKLFNIQGVPHYLLIDKEGRIANGKATRPSDPATAHAIKALL